MEQFASLSCSLSEMNASHGKAWIASGAVELRRHCDAGNADWKAYCALAKKALQDNEAIDVEDEKMRQLERVLPEQMRQLERVFTGGEASSAEQRFEEQRVRVEEMIECAPHRQDVIQIKKVAQLHQPRDTTPRATAAVTT
jgi:G:T/U-mismatch repair DNA glycosylase